MRHTRLGGLDVRITGGTDGDGAGEGPVVILLHGFGAPGNDLVDLWRRLAAPRGTRYVFPEGPIALGPAYGGGRAWWRIDLEDRIRRQHEGTLDIAAVPDGLEEARACVIDLLDAIEQTLRPPTGKVVLGGFSQGAMLSLDVALWSPLPLAGLVLMSGTHIAAGEWAERLETRRGLPVLMSHGHDDELLPFAVAEGLRDTLIAAGMPVEWIPFRGGHGIHPHVLTRLGEFLARVLA
jgi:phospholipase/carboxylesterase